MYASNLNGFPDDFVGTSSSVRRMSSVNGFTMSSSVDMKGILFKSPANRFTARARPRLVVATGTLLCNSWMKLASVICRPSTGLERPVSIQRVPVTTWPVVRTRYTSSSRSLGSRFISSIRFTPMAFVTSSGKSVSSRSASNTSMMCSSVKRIIAVCRYRFSNAGVTTVSHAAGNAVVSGKVNGYSISCSCANFCNSYSDT